MSSCSVKKVVLRSTWKYFLDRFIIDDESRGRQKKIVGYCNCYGFSWNGDKRNPWWRLVFLFISCFHESMSCRWRPGTRKPDREGQGFNLSQVRRYRTQWLQRTNSVCDTFCAAPLLNSRDSFWFGSNSSKMEESGMQIEIPWDSAARSCAQATLISLWFVEKGHILAHKCNNIMSCLDHFPLAILWRNDNDIQEQINSLDA